MLPGARRVAGTMCNRSGSNFASLGRVGVGFTCGRLEVEVWKWERGGPRTAVGGRQTASLRVNRRSVVCGPRSHSTTPLRSRWGSAAGPPSAGEHGFRSPPSPSTSITDTRSRTSLSSTTLTPTSSARSTGRPDRSSVRLIAPAHPHLRMFTAQFSFRGPTVIRRCKCEPWM